MKFDLKFEMYLRKLKDPEYYMEFEGHEVRLAISKMKAFMETLGDAYLSITYSNKSEYNNTNSTETNMIRRIHTRHAIIDLNNSFDLLLQIPWFYYRIWTYFNKSGSLYSSNKYKNSPDIIRNSKNWVEKSEKNCTYPKLIRFLTSQNDKELLTIKTKLDSFNCNYILNRNKDFTIRTLANQMKHNHSLKLKEFYNPYDYNVNINNKKINLRKQQLGINLNADFYDIENYNHTLGTIKMNYFDDLYIDIEYKNGESFLAKDYMEENKRFNLDDIYKEMIKYRDELLELYEIILNIIEQNLVLNPLLSNNPSKKIKTVNLDKYFKC